VLSCRASASLTLTPARRSSTIIVRSRWPSARSPIVRITATISSTVGRSAGHCLPLLRGARPWRYPGLVAGERRWPAASSSMDSVNPPSWDEIDDCCKFGRPALARTADALERTRLRGALQAERVELVAGLRVDVRSNRWRLTVGLAGGCRQPQMLKTTRSGTTGAMPSAMCSGSHRGRKEAL
jgi:hypothetical protein